MQRFAFYGRVSTEDQQDPESSRRWQLHRASSILPDDAAVVAEFFDIGQSRSLPWKRRPEAARLLATLSDPARGFDAVVIGEPQRAFYGGQFGLTFPVFTHFGVGLWVPEVGGAVDPGSEAHDLVMSLFGGMAKGERTRIKTRVRTAMEAMAATEGRYLGGRPPYGYRLADAGPHPNPAKAADGKRLHRLEVDSAAAAVVERIYRMYLAGHGFRAIAQRLTDDGILSPSASDPGRNRHRPRHAWAGSAVRAILTNPRYTGYQVWGRAPKHELLADVDDVAAGHVTVQRLAPEERWVRSLEPAHVALVDDETWTAVQALMAAKGRTRPRQGRAARADRGSYILTGMVECGICGRRMSGHRARERPGYRCRIRVDYAQTNDGHPPTLFVGENALMRVIDDWLAELFSPSNMGATAERIAAAAPQPDGRRTVLGRQRDEASAALERLLDAIEAGHIDPTDVANRISNHRSTVADADAALAALPDIATVDAATVLSVLNKHEGITGVLAAATPEERSAFYEALNLRVVYDPGERAVDLHLSLNNPHTGGANGGVGGGT